MSLGGPQPAAQVTIEALKQKTGSHYLNQLWAFKQRDSCAITGLTDLWVNRRDRGESTSQTSPGSSQPDSSQAD
jgi:hypothetical protein